MKSLKCSDVNSILNHADFHLQAAKHGVDCNAVPLDGVRQSAIMHDSRITPDDHICWRSQSPLTWTRPASLLLSSHRTHVVVTPPATQLLQIPCEISDTPPFAVVVLPYGSSDLQSVEVTRWHPSPTMNEIPHDSVKWGADGEVTVPTLEMLLGVDYQELPHPVKELWPECDNIPVDVRPATTECQQAASRASGTSTEVSNSQGDILSCSPVRRTSSTEHIKFEDEWI